ncbi:MAG: LLM class flavin-dependent oxidoreductase, partial [Chloroflexota bacterium]|nr:LLM class flavin-dependent oxidoreductase [Chloroflexota bacterium]
VLFGLNISSHAGTGADPTATARAAEALGFDFISINDHLHGPDPRFETWTLLCWIGASTSRIRLATRVLGLPYREPPIVAKMAETLDRLSQGRLILGLGAGSAEEEFRALGLRALSLRDRIKALDEAIRVIRGLWADRSFTFEGDIYRTDGAQPEPKPERRIPIWLGAHGRRGLAVTARLADGWIPSLAHAPPDQLPAMIELLHDDARAVGRDPADVTCIYNLQVTVNERGRDESVVSGSPERVAEQLLGFARLGFHGFNLIPTGADRSAQTALLAQEVVPFVRAAL